MKNKKEFLSVLVSVLICVFLVGVIVYATTTIGDPITVGTDLTVTSGARIGTGTTPGHITALADDSLLIEGDMEVDGTVYFDGDLAIRGSAAPAVELSVVGTASISEDLWASGSFQFGGGEGIATVSYSRLGSATTGHSLSNANDLVINGSLEVDGTAYFDGLVSVSSSGLLLDGGATIIAGVTSQSAACVLGSIYVNTALGNISICDVNGDWSPITIQ